MADERGLSLYDILPQYIRQQDTNHHTRRYLEGADAVLDGLYQTLRQFYGDNFPGQPGVDAKNTGPGDPDRIVAQEWLLPYFADLLDARLLSPLTEGRRLEVDRAVAWRQRKGTLAVVDDISEAVGGWETVVQEGWTRVAMTPRLGAPLQQESLYGVDATLDRSIPQQMTKHPGLPTVTPDFRLGSRAVRDPAQSVYSQVSDINGERVRWRQYYRHGVPCHHQRIDLDGQFHGAAFDDVSLRTPDLRDSDWRVGHYHPKKVLIHFVQPEGFFPSQQPGAHRVQWKQQWLDDEELPSEAFLAAVAFYCRLDGTLVFESRLLQDAGLIPIEVRGVFKLGQVPISGVGDADDGAWHFAGLSLVNRIEADKGRVSFDRCAVRQIAVHSIDTDTPVLTATNTLFSRVQTARGLTRLEYCSVLDRCVVEALQASDVLFTCLFRKDHLGIAPPQPLCLRYSRVHPDQLPATLASQHHNSSGPVEFFGKAFGDPGSGVLHPATAKAVWSGAEDGTEIGAFHFLYLCQRFEAVRDKLEDYLPVGYEAVMIPDGCLAPKSIPRAP
ncbi:hypothetical protein [Halomonas urumqiensis]|uniref:Uncharacterized protein n=1 Tax=Halomonas urumqiensis TaxID=1684789 RepID=A0A2N7UD09_9GAMM|nr:hypothetical protein [Halomonas urumqiensis]PMR78307.1 hypothetical protein C1H70_16235 [Halomonas urumqiensis]PTB03454.1 hypothetical protein C6V82_02870 [Halomonas urumqiensis]GHE20361.1 hypothetical protein GCM10017767_08820 [Halomonas urumqiensis]